MPSDSIREALIALGIALALISIPVIAWSSLAIASVDRSEEVYDEFIELNWGVNPYPLEDEFDRERSFLSAIRVAGIIGAITGLVLLAYAYFMRDVSGYADTIVCRSDVQSDGARHYCEFCGGPTQSGSVRCDGCGRVLTPEQEQPETLGDSS